MSFEPSTNLYIGAVDFSNDYKDILYIPNRAEQQAYFASCCPTALKRDDYTYQRMDKAVVVPYNAETLYGYNYCMFQNENYGTRWFYAFITDVEYINPKSSKLYLEIDIMQTWFLDCEVKPCFVEREHVNDDTIGKHIRDEGMDTGEMKCQYTIYDESSFYIIVACAAEPLTDGTYVNNKGDLYLGVASGVSLSVFPTNQIGQFKAFIQALADNGQQDAISAIYMVPATALPGVSNKSNGYGKWVDASRPVNNKTLTFDMAPTTLDGYTPKNNKMYCYPYEYIEINNNAGQSQQLRIEFCAAIGVLELMRTAGIDINASQVYIPVNYNGMGTFYEGMVTMPPYPTCNWVYQAYANTMGQSRYEFELPSLVEDFNGNKYGDLGYVKGDMKSDMQLKNFLGNVTSLNFAGMAAGSYNIEAQLSQLQRKPNTSRGGTNSTITMVNIDAYKLIVRKWVTRYEMAKQIDDYFSVFGYKVIEMKKPNITGRNSWNYVKTNGSSVMGRVPTPVLALINSLFDRGLTFWHTDDIGNYSLDNSII